MRVPWTARTSNQSILKEISPGISLEEMMLKLKLQYFGHLMQRVDSLEKSLMLGGIGGKRREAQEGGDICIIMADFALLCSRNRASLVAQMVKNPPAMQETWVQSLR